MLVFFTKPFFSKCEWYFCHKKAFSEKGLEKVMANVVFLAWGNTSVNAIVKNVLIKLFRYKMPRIGFIWYFSHRSELVLKDDLSEWMNPIAGNLQNWYYIDIILLILLLHWYYYYIIDITSNCWNERVITIDKFTIIIRYEN